MIIDTVREKIEIAYKDKIEIMSYVDTKICSKEYASPEISECNDELTKYHENQSIYQDDFIKNRIPFDEFIPHPIPLNYRENLRKEVGRMLDLKIIRKSISPYINLIKVVIKKDGSLRLCLDAKKLNEKLMDDFEAPPDVNELFPRCADAQYITNLDLAASYWQIPLDEESKKYTAFKCDNHVYEFNVVAFGIKTSGAAFLRGLHQIIYDIKDFIISFVDDIAVVLKTFKQHLEHLELLFQRLLKHNLRLNFHKCNFAQQEISFLGHILYSKGLRPDPEKLNKIRDFERPRNLKQLQRFLGFVNFYTKFVNNYSKHVIPLLGLLKKDAPYIWTDEHNLSFEEIK